MGRSGGVTFQFSQFLMNLPQRVLSICGFAKLFGGFGGMHYRCAPKK
jgi:hypothetical protein